MNQTNKQELMNKLFNEYKDDIEKVVSYYITQILNIKKNNSDIYDDTYQDIMVYICNNIHKFNINKSNMNTFIKLLCKNYYLFTLSRNNRENRKADFNSLSFDDLLNDSDSDSFIDLFETTDDDEQHQDFEDDIINKLFYQDCIKEIKTMFGDKQAKAFELYLNDYSMRYIQQNIFPEHEKNIFWVKKSINNSINYIKHLKKLKITDY